MTGNLPTSLRIIATKPRPVEIDGEDGTAEQGSLTARAAYVSDKSKWYHTADQGHYLFYRGRRYQGWHSQVLHLLSVLETGDTWAQELFDEFGLYMAPPIRRIAAAILRGDKRHKTAAAYMRTGASRRKSREERERRRCYDIDA